MFIGFFSGEVNVSQAIIQYQDVSGNWIPCMNVPNEPTQIIQGMRTAEQNMRDVRVRAVDEDGRLLDNL